MCVHVQYCMQVQYINMIPDSIWHVVITAECLGLPKPQSCWLRAAKHIERDERSICLPGPERSQRLTRLPRGWASKLLGKAFVSLGVLAAWLSFAASLARKSKIF